MTSSNLVGVSTGSSLGRAPPENSVDQKQRTDNEASCLAARIIHEEGCTQGGGALGSYQAGVYEALASSDYKPDWVAGISIGAINAAIIVGNRPENRVKCLRSFWEEVTAQTNLL